MKKHHEKRPSERFKETKPDPKNEKALLTILVLTLLLIPSLGYVLTSQVEKYLKKDEIVIAQSSPPQKPHADYTIRGVAYIIDGNFEDDSAEFWALAQRLNEDYASSDDTRQKLENANIALKTSLLECERATPANAIRAIVGLEAAFNQCTRVKQ